jgi:hypothetical protein
MNENLMRSTMKADPAIHIQDRYFELQKSEQAKKARPVEESQAGGKTEGKEDRDQNDTRFVMDEKKVVFEKYNKDGDLILRLPSSYLPVDELA